MQFDWDVHNTDHLARHGVSPDEVEQALVSDLMDLDHRITEDGEDRWTAVGQTRAGRVLVVVWTMRYGDHYRVITAYPATGRLEAIYRNIMHEG